MIKRMLIMLIAVGILFGGIFGYKAFTNAMMMKYMMMGGAKPVVVSSIKAAVHPWQPRIRAVGTLRAVRGVDVSSEVAGAVEGVYFKSGDEVKAGKILVRLNVDADLAQLRALEASAALARTVYDRDKKQLAVQAISQAVVDADAAELKARRAQVAQQAAMVAKKIIRAPFDGKAGISRVNPGQYLNPGEKIVTVQALESVYVDFYLPQQELARVAIGQDVDVAIDSYPGRDFAGIITAINAKVETDSRNIEVEAVIDNPKHELFPGMFASVEVQAGRIKNQITIPQSAVIFNPYGATVFLVEKKAEEGKEPVLVAKQTFVLTGETRGDQIAVIKGIQEGDMVVTAGQMKLKNGSVVVINNEVQPTNDLAPQPVD